MIIFSGNVFGGELTIFDNGDYRFARTDPGSGATDLQLYRAGEGPERLRVFVERTLATQTSRLGDSLVGQRAGALGPVAPSATRSPPMPTERGVGVVAAQTVPAPEERGVVQRAGPPLSSSARLSQQLDENERQLRDLRTSIAHAPTAEQVARALRLTRGLVRELVGNRHWGDGFAGPGQASVIDLPMAVERGEISEDYADTLRFVAHIGVLERNLEHLIRNQSRLSRRRQVPEELPLGMPRLPRRTEPTELERYIEAGLVVERSGSAPTIAWSAELPAWLSEQERYYPGVRQVHRMAYGAADAAIARQELVATVLLVADLALLLIGLAGLLIRIARMAGGALLVRLCRAGPILRSEVGGIRAARAAASRAGAAPVRPGAGSGGSATVEAAPAAGESASASAGPSTSAAAARRVRQPRGYDVGLSRLVPERSGVLEAIRQSPTLRRFGDVIERAFQGARWQEIAARGRRLRDAARRGGASLRGAINNLKGLVQESVLRALPWFEQTKELSQIRLVRINGGLPSGQRFDWTIFFTANVQGNGHALTDGIFYARSADGSRVVILDIIEAKSMNWEALVNGSRSQIARDIHRFLEQTISIDGQTFRHADGSLRFMSDYGFPQAWSLSVPAEIPNSPTVIQTLRDRAARPAVSGRMPSVFTVRFGALPNEEARRLATIILRRIRSGAAR